jgi:alpha-tubulin suppressor-like RCC1 family protein
MWSPVEALTITDAVDIAAGGLSVFALRADSTVLAWGYNNYGQLGNGNTTNQAVPVPVVGLTGVVDIACGTEVAMALKSDGTVWTWGRNDGGLLGNGTTTSSNVPVQVQGLTDVVSIAAGDWNFAAVRSDSTVWTWGSSAGNAASQVAGIDQVVEVSVFQHWWALRADATMWTWGSNINGQQGTGDQWPRSAPVEVIGNCDLNASVNERSSDNVIQATPNPMVDHSTIRSTRTIRSFELFDAVGRMVSNGSVNASSFILERGNLPSGMYHLIVRAEGGSTSMRLVVP